MFFDLLPCTAAASRSYSPRRLQPMLTGSILGEMQTTSDSSSGSHLQNKKYTL